MEEDQINLCSVEIARGVDVRLLGCGSRVLSRILQANNKNTFLPHARIRKPFTSQNDMVDAQVTLIK